VRWLGSTIDIHDRVNAEDQVRQTQRLQAVAKLAGGMAHEVNNMMSVVLGYGELVSRDLGADHPLRRDVEEMVKAGLRATAVTRQLLAFSRQQVLKPVVLDIGTVVSDLSPALQRVLGSDRRLEVVPGSAQCRVLADRTQVEQVLVNLVANARDATGAGGLVLIEIQRVELTHSEVSPSEALPGSFVRLAVRDDGAGMTPETLSRVFEPFFTTKPADQGTGLGLSMVHGVVRQSGGFVRIESSPGKGTIVAVFLPRVEDPVTPTEPPVSVRPGAGERVLVVEDESVVRSLVRRTLESHGYRVYLAPNGAAALSFITANPGEVDLVLTDVVMPRMNGLELAAQLAERLPALPVLLMSGYSDDEILQRGLTPPGAAFLPKPMAPDHLAAAVREHLDRALRRAGQGAT
jgi:nitrogen-specific signal transduction histidine kinase/ActR/RegA family two-component response regulator